MEAALQWLRSQAGVPSASACRDVGGLQDGAVLLDLARLVLKGSVNRATGLNREMRLRKVVEMLREDSVGLHGERMCPRHLLTILSRNESKEDLALGDGDLVWLLRYLRFISGNGPPPAGSELVPDEFASAHESHHVYKAGHHAISAPRPPIVLPRSHSISPSRGRTSPPRVKAAWGVSSVSFERPRRGILLGYTKIRTPSPSRPARESERPDSFLEWLREHGIDASAVGNGEEDGLLRAMMEGAGLCRLLCSLEKIKLCGVVWEPVRRASMLHNVEKALETLRKKRTMPTRYLYSATQIVLGDVETIWGLLGDIYTNYTGHNLPSNLSLDLAKNKPRSPHTDDVSRSEGSRSASLSPELEEIRPASGSPVQSSTAHATIPGIADNGVTARSAGDVAFKIKRYMPHVQDGGGLQLPIGTKNDVAAWLDCLSLPVRAWPFEGAVPSLPALDDPLRNGVLLLAVVESLKGSKGLQTARILPRTLAEARANLELALKRLGKGPDALPKQSPALVEALLRGDEGCAWGLIRVIQESFPEARTKRRKRPVRGLPYSGPKCAALERALLEWLWELPVGGLQEKLGGNIQALIPAFRDGVLLADIALYITGRDARIYRSVKTPKVAEINMMRVCEMLMLAQDVGHVYCRDPERILMGDKGTVMGVLEELMRCHHGIPPNLKIMSKGKEVPFLGRRSVKTPGNSPLASSLPASSLAFSPPSTAHIARPANPAPVVSFPHEIAANAVAAELQWEIASVHSCDTASPAPFPVSFFREDRRPVTQETPPEHVTASQIGRHSPCGRDRGFARGVDVDFRLAKRIASLRIWLRGLNLQRYPKGVLKGGVDAFLGAFWDGVFLCDLINSLETIHGGTMIQAIERKGKAPAICRHNVSKAMDVLRMKRNMPITHLYSPEGIVDEEAEAIIPVLEQMRRAYAGLLPLKPREEIVEV